MSALKRQRLCIAALKNKTTPLGGFIRGAELVPLLGSNSSYYKWAVNIIFLVRNSWLRQSVLNIASMKALFLSLLHFWRL